MFDFPFLNMKVSIKKTRGNVIISNNQSGGITTSTNTLGFLEKNRKPIVTIAILVTLLAELTAILNYMNIKPFNNDKDKQETINIKDVSGDTVFSINQTGGITAHTIINEEAPPKWAFRIDLDTMNMLGGENNYTVTFSIVSTSDKVPILSSPLDKSCRVLSGPESGSFVWPEFSGGGKKTTFFCESKSPFNEEELSKLLERTNIPK